MIGFLEKETGRSGRSASGSCWPLTLTQSASNPTHLELSAIPHNLHDREHSGVLNGCLPERIRQEARHAN